ncbi:hypothetical protein, partial [Pseudomonas carnis]|uniref:hypothetical protein n=1 Tax=Pseudomonas carnis TaxID=2487355 RepID=UPI001F1B706B
FINSMKRFSKLKRRDSVGKGHEEGGTDKEVKAMRLRAGWNENASGRCMSFGPSVPVTTLR